CRRPSASRTRSPCGCWVATNATGSSRSSTWMRCCAATSKSVSAPTKSAGTSACIPATKCVPRRTCLPVQAATYTIRRTRVAGRPATATTGVIAMSDKFIKLERDFTITKSLDEAGEFEGYASVFDTEDHHGDTVKKG